MTNRLTVLAILGLFAAAAMTQTAVAQAPKGPSPAGRAPNVAVAPPNAVPPTPAPSTAAAAAAPQASAETDQAELAQLKAFANTRAYAALRKQALSNVSPNVFKSCDSLVAGGSQTTIMMAMKFADNGFPVAGAWKQSVEYTGCGPDIILNFYFIARSDQAIGIVVGTPGTTLANPVLQHNAEIIAITGASTAVQDQGAVPCPSYTVTNTSFQAYGLENPPTPDPGPSSHFRPWWENWTVAGCGRAFLVPLDFIPHPDQPLDIQQPGHVTQVRIQAVGGDAPNPYASPAPKPPSDAPASDAPAPNAPASTKP